VGGLLHRDGIGGYPRSPLSGTDCEPFTVTAGHGVPEFPIGLPMLMALAFASSAHAKVEIPRELSTRWFAIFVSSELSSGTTRVL
jgi:hypothetical protein